MGVWGYYLLVKIAAIKSEKAKKWIQGRKETWKILESIDPGKNTFWFHCASLGEFEQARPLIERLKSENSENQIAVSFFSPSGYEIRKNYELADVVFYLPLDSKKNAKRLFDLIQPSKVFFVKYEFWAHFIFEARKRVVPIYLVSAVFRSNQLFFKWYGRFMRRILESFNLIFVQNKESELLLKDINVSSVLAGDTRYDRTLANAEKVVRYDDVAHFCGSSKVIVCGSIWKEDLEVVGGVLDNLEDVKLIVAPHNIDESMLRTTTSFFTKKQVIRYSEIESLNGEEVLLIDNIGMLMNLYQYGDFAYVGGAFRTGLHNILEPASFGLPVIFGCQTEKFPEAKLFVENGIGFQVANTEQFQKVLNQIVQHELSQNVKQFMKDHAGAAEVIWSRV